MEHFVRYAIYHAPAPGPLADFGAAWLGWDATTGTETAHPQVPGLPRPAADLTQTPRKYGFHGTIKPPFRLATGTGADALHHAMSALAARLAPVRMPGLALTRLGHFLALTPEGDATPLADLAATVLQDLDRFRAPPAEAELARRQAAGLSPRQQALLDRWGYPYVMEEFLFHMTLTGALPEDAARATADALAPVLAPLLPRPFRVDSLCLFGEGTDGRFRLLHRYTLSG